MTTEEMIHGLMNGTVCEKDLAEDDWRQISAHQKLTEAFISEHADRVDWRSVSQFQRLSEPFIRKYADFVNWVWISTSQGLSEGFMREYAASVDWKLVSMDQKLSEALIREHADDVNWALISMHQTLTENFIREYEDRVDWDSISQYQRLPEGLIAEYEDRVNWENISRYQHLSNAFIQAHKDRLDMDQIRDNWSYKTPEDLEQAVRDSGWYECHEGYCIAYKGIRSDRYGHDNFRYRYMPGETYETFADCSDDPYSFGFFAWTREDAKKYYREVIVPCRIEYKDVARIIEDGRIRCRKLTVLE